jgi:transcriptional regulator with XRE-family HTH domain
MDRDENEPAAQQGALARKIVHLIATVYPDERTRPGFAKLSEKIRESTGSTISSTYLWELATGKKHNLTQGTLATLAKFFGVPGEYFFDDEVAARVDSQLELALALRNHKVRSIALRSEGLSDETLDSILAMLTQARKIERLPSVDEGSDELPGDEPPGADG